MVDKPTLNLNKYDNSAKYEEFIKSMIQQFPKFFSAEFSETILQNRPVNRTYHRKELGVNTDSDWVFEVSLIHEDATLDILIQKSNLYLVGYKGIVADETGRVEKWILLKQDHRKHVKTYIESKYANHGTLVDPIEAQLKTTYHSLFSTYESGFEKEVQDELNNGLYAKLERKLKNRKNHQERVLERKYDNKKFAGKSEDLETYEARDKEKAEKESTIAEKQVPRLKRVYEKDGVEGILSWVEELKKTDEILKKVKKKLEKESDKEVGEEPDKKSDKEVEKELDAVKKLVKKIEKKLGKKNDLEYEYTEETEKQATELLQKDRIKKLRGETTLWEDLLIKQFTDVPNWKEFHQDLKMKPRLLTNLMKVLSTDAFYKILKKKTEQLKLNKIALIEAVKHLTAEPFHDDKDSAKHLIILAQMICEATRFEGIAEHLRVNYTESEDENASLLPTELIDLQHTWTEGSNIITRGYFYNAEAERWKDSCKEFTVIRARTEEQSQLE